ncbi:hypothetical protein LTR94_033846, partial [Friedmanniomyces endolithicus]
FLWWSEKSGHGHLYRVNGAKWTALTSGNWEVRDVVGVDEARGLVYFTGNRETPLEQQLYVTSLDKAGQARALTAKGWWNDAVMDGAASKVVVTRQNADQPKQVYLADSSGKQLQWLSQNALKGSHPYAPYVADH